MGDMSEIEHIIEIKSELGQISAKIEASEKERADGKQTQKEISEKLDHLTQRMSVMPDDEHKEHHDFMKQFIESEKRRQESYKAITNKILAGGAWAVVCALGALCWYGLKDVISKKLGGG